MENGKRFPSRMTLSRYIPRLSWIHAARGAYPAVHAESGQKQRGQVAQLHEGGTLVSCSISLFSLPWTAAT